MSIYYLSATPDTIVSLVNGGKLEYRDELYCAQSFQDSIMAYTDSIEDIYVLELDFKAEVSGEYQVISPQLNFDFNYVENEPIRIPRDLVSLERIFVYSEQAKLKLFDLLDEDILEQSPLAQRICVAPELYPSIKDYKKMRKEVEGSPEDYGSGEKSRKSVKSYVKKTIMTFKKPAPQASNLPRLKRTRSFYDVSTIGGGNSMDATKIPRLQRRSSICLSAEQAGRELAALNREPKPSCPDGPEIILYSVITVPAALYGNPPSIMPPLPRPIDQQLINLSKSVP